MSSRHARERQQERGRYFSQGNEEKRHAGAYSAPVQEPYQLRVNPKPSTFRTKVAQNVTVHARPERHVSARAGDDVKDQQMHHRLVRDADDARGRHHRRARTLQRWKHHHVRRKIKYHDR